MAVKEGIIAAYNMSGIEKSMDDFFASKATMNFLGIPTMSLGITSGYDESYIEEIDLDNLGNYKKLSTKMELSMELYYKETSLMLGY